MSAPQASFCMSFPIQKELEAGYYWIKLEGQSAEVAWYTGAVWYVPGSECSFFEGGSAFEILSSKLECPKTGVSSWKPVTTGL